MSRIVVIGAGIAGLASAGMLARDGHAVTLVEQGEALGGRAGTWRSKGFTFDTGPSWMLMREPYEQAFRMLGSRLEDELDLVRLDPAYRVLYEGEPEPLEVSSTRRARTRGAGSGGAGRARRGCCSSRSSRASPARSATGACGRRSATRPSSSAPSRARRRRCTTC